MLQLSAGKFTARASLKYQVMNEFMERVDEKWENLEWPQYCIWISKTTNQNLCIIVSLYASIFISLY